jgi:hypothetical protein
LICTQVLALVARGTKGRATRATRSNEHSSRSHAVLQLALEVESVEKGNDENNDPARWSQFAASDVPPSTAQTPGTAGTRTVVRRAKLSLVDLAGSEKWSDAVRKSTSGLSETFVNLHAIEPPVTEAMSRRWRFNLHSIEQTQSPERHRVDGVGRSKFDFHIGLTRSPRPNSSRASSGRSTRR